MTHRGNAVNTAVWMVSSVLKREEIQAKWGDHSGGVAGQILCNTSVYRPLNKGRRRGCGMCSGPTSTEDNLPYFPKKESQSASVVQGYEIPFPPPSLFSLFLGPFDFGNVLSHTLSKTRIVNQ